MSSDNKTGSAEAPSHTDLMVAPEAIDHLLDRERIAQHLRSFAGYLDTIPAHYDDVARDLRIAADMVDGTI